MAHAVPHHWLVDPRGDWLCAACGVAYDRLAAPFMACPGPAEPPPAPDAGAAPPPPGRPETWRDRPSLL